MPVADGTAKFSGRDYDFRESTLRREPTVRSEDFCRELHDESGESQPTETTDDAEARADFWSIQGDFIQELGTSRPVAGRLHCRFQHLRQVLRHENGNLLDVIHAVAQLLFPCFDTQGLQPRIRILESTDHRAIAVATIKLELRVLLDIRNTFVHIVTQTRLQHVDRALGHHALRYHAGFHRPVKTVGLVGCRVMVVCGHCG